MSNTNAGAIKLVTHLVEDESINNMTLLSVCQWLVSLGEKTSWDAVIRGSSPFYVTWTAPETVDEYLKNEDAKYRQELAAKEKRRQAYEMLKQEFAMEGSDWK